MKTMRTVLFSGVWIVGSEFLRNEIVLKQYWIRHYHDLGLTFSTAPLNGIIWFMWSFVLAGIICALARSFSLRETALISWFAGFVLMWLVAFNLQVLPLEILVVTVPWSMGEVLVASWIAKRTLRGR